MRTLVLFITALLSLLSACANKPKQQGVQIANPASVYCIQQGGKLQIVRDASGAEQGFCILLDGRTIDEWDYFREKK